MDRAKYIEGLENRLARMESLLKLAGLLPNGDDETDLGDLGDLERRLQESAAAPASSSQKAPSNVGSSCGSSGPGGCGSGGGQSSATESVRDTPSSTQHSNLNSPRDEAEAEDLSDQMCSLVADNCGEVRFIGMFSTCRPQGERGGEREREKGGKRECVREEVRVKVRVRVRE